jgi:hypothetical protein
VPRALDEVVARALAKAPGERYPTGAAMAEDLEDVAAGGPPRHARRLAAAAGDATHATPLAPGTAPVRTSAPPPPAPAFAGWRRTIVAAGVTLAVLAAALTWTRGAWRPPAATRTASVPAATAPAVVDDAPAPLTVDFEHHLRAGTLKVWVDDALVLERDLEGRVERRLAGRVRLYKGRVLEDLEVTPGRRAVRVEVAWDGKVRTSRTSAVFQPGRGRRLDVQVVRVLDDLVLEWR